MPKHKDESIHVPTILEQQVSTAISNIELNIYLSYIHSIEDKTTFLTKYSAFKKEGTAHSTKMMQQFRDQKRLAEDEPAVWEETKTWTNKRTNETHIIYEKGAPKYNVQNLPTMAESEKMSLEKELEKVNEEKRELQGMVNRLQEQVSKIHVRSADCSPTKPLAKQS